eukprot:TRINITY_DN6113_c0_g1_i1.p1 TRINITY_DN6113_c0_g1~~TRINITY_DN6113_c0_g1_i1.p1  ORF type:complete len:351 (+),score=83.09 TRINITY_DN6113_c0_g1_i1:760-1812(+)
MDKDSCPIPISTQPTQLNHLKMWVHESHRQPYKVIQDESLHKTPTTTPHIAISKSPSVEGFDVGRHWASEVVPIGHHLVAYGGITEHDDAFQRHEAVVLLGEEGPFDFFVKGKKVLARYRTTVSTFMEDSFIGVGGTANQARNDLFVVQTKTQKNGTIVFSNITRKFNVDGNLPSKRGGKKMTRVGEAEWVLATDSLQQIVLHLLSFDQDSSTFNWEEIDINGELQPSGLNIDSIVHWNGNLVIVGRAWDFMLPKPVLQIWSFNLESGEWRELSVCEGMESRRGLCCGVFDDLLVMYGGVIDETKKINDVKVLSLHDETWLSVFLFPFPISPFSITFDSFHPYNSFKRSG